MPSRIIKRFSQVDSTNSVAEQLAAAGADAFTVVVAEVQTKGRGRLSRGWHSPPGTGLYFSVILRPVLAVADLPKITLAAAVAVCFVLEGLCDLNPTIKWPNDILLGGRKVCGILTESSLTESVDETSHQVIMGVGLNVANPGDGFPPALRTKATSIQSETGKVFLKDALLDAILNQLERLVGQLEKGRFNSVFDEWRRRDGMRGRTLSWLTPEQEVVAGMGLGLDDNGTYHIRDRGGRVHEVISGDVKPVDC